MVATLLQMTVHDILQRPLFHSAEAIASEEALQRTVRWVHIMEVTEVSHLLNGGELILSTGIGWQGDEGTSVSFVQQLIESGASGLCIELGAYANRPCEEMISLARAAHFPLILFHEQVRYIDITLDLHTHFIHQHHRMVSELEALSTRLSRMLLSGQGVTPLLQLLQETTAAQVALFPLHGDQEFIPPLPPSEAEAFYQRWIYGEIFAAPEIKSRLAHRPILALDQLFADLLLHAPQELTEFQVLALDRFAAAIAQELMRTRYMEEKRQHREDSWILEWISGSLSAQEVREQLTKRRPSLQCDRLLTAVWELPPALQDSRNFETLMIQKHMVARAAWENEGWVLMPACRQGQLIWILLDQRGGAACTERISRALARLRRMEEGQEQPWFSSLVGIGCEVRDPGGIAESYHAALETLAIQRDVGQLAAPFYSELHLYRILSGLKKTGQLPSLISEYIGPLIEYDRERNAQLLRTLKVYLTTSGSKRETAQALFIVRQTLYHRLDKIASLLGTDFMAPHKRLTTEFVLKAYEYMHGEIV